MNSYCEKIKPLLSEYVDETLDAWRSAEIAKHLPTCASCRQLVEDFRANVNLLGSLPLKQTSTAFDSALARRLAAIQEERARRSWLAGIADAFRPSRTNVWRPAFATVAAVVIVGGGIYSTFPRTQIITPPPTANSALIDQCVAEHRNYAESQPLSDFSAQTLADQEDDGSL